MDKNKIFIYGVPGVGKTYYSKMLGKKLNAPVVEGDKIRDECKKVNTKKINPFLFLGTCEAYSEFGDLDYRNVAKGLLAVRQALNDAVLTEISKHDKLILEAAFLNPAQLKNFGEVILLTTIDEKAHEKRFLNHFEKRFDIQRNEFRAARLAQQYLIQEARKLEVEVVENNKLL